MCHTGLYPAALSSRFLSEAVALSRNASHLAHHRYFLCSYCVQTSRQPLRLNSDKTPVTASHSVVFNEEIKWKLVANSKNPLSCLLRHGFITKHLVAVRVIRRSGNGGHMSEIPSMGQLLMLGSEAGDSSLPFPVFSQFWIQASC